MALSVFAYFQHSRERALFFFASFFFLLRTYFTVRRIAGGKSRRCLTKRGSVAIGQTLEVKLKYK